VKWPLFLRLNNCAVSISVTAIFFGAHAMNPEQLAGVEPSNPEHPLGDARRYGAIPIETDRHESAASVPDADKTGNP
jgi:hypothetical protein